jgi:hypothetical protein
MISTTESNDSFNILEENDADIEEELYYDTRTNNQPTIRLNVHSIEPNVDDMECIDIENGITNISKNKKISNREQEFFIDELRNRLNNIQNATETRTDNGNIYRIIANGMYQGNSPITMSSNGSENTSDVEMISRNIKKKPTHKKRLTFPRYINSGESETNSESSQKKIPRFKKLTFEQVEESLQKHYNKNYSFSSELDILITFLKGQKHIYSQANKMTLRKYYALTIPAILITSSVAIIAPFLSHFYWNGWLFSGLNAIVTLLISLSDRFKLQSSSQMFLNMSMQFNKLEISLEFTRNQILFIEDENEKKRMILEKMTNIEEKWMEFRELNPILVPIEIQMQNPIISHINIFSFIKKIECYKKDLILKYKDIKNEIQYIMHKWNEEEECLENTLYEMHSFESNGTNFSNQCFLKKNHEKERLSHLLSTKQQTKTELIHFSNAYVYIDDLFSREIQHSEYYETWFGGILFFLGFIKERPKPKTYENANPVVDNYLNFIFT